MIPWDFGLINALRAKLDVGIFPPDPPNERLQTPHIILELKNIRRGIGWTTRVELQLKIVDDENPSSAANEITKNIQKIITEKLTLKRGRLKIGEANIKLEKIVIGGSSTILNLTALLNLKTIYNNDGNQEDEEVEEIVEDEEGDEDERDE